VNRKTLFAALACALLVFSMLGCGTTNHLQSIQLSVSNTQPPSVAGNYVNIYGTDQPGRYYVWASYSNGKQVLLSGGVAYQISITPGSTYLSAGGYVPLTFDPNANPPQTIQLSSDGTVTAVSPYVCTWENFATTGTTPNFAYVGSYSVTATYQGLTTPPASLPVASDVVGVTSASNLSGLCNNPPK
jgi:hypothetical protein